MVRDGFMSRGLQSGLLRALRSPGSWKRVGSYLLQPCRADDE